jgi:hypothetical protein
MSFETDLAAWANRLAEAKATEAVEVIAKHVGQNTPVESGHARQIWESAFNSVPGVNVRIDEASGDPEAATRGSADVSRRKDSVTIEVHANAGFIRTMEYGGVIRPIAPGGTKEGDHEFPGPFMGPRNPGPPAGWLAFRGSDGRVRFARSVTRSANLFVTRAVQEAANEIRQ